MNNVKKYYKTKYHSQHNLSASNIKLYNFILELDIKTIFEFGCNVGRHLFRLRNFGYDVSGIDINKEFIIEANEQGLHCGVGDEKKLKKLKDNKFDLCFTNSVICHMPAKDAKVAIENLKRISSKYVILFECVTKKNDFWWIHDYEKFGFKPMLESDSHLKHKNNATYKLFFLEI